ncbi:hypothetical protein GCK32_010958 [Trichostrongylus colubriformis]|uniref:CWH43-like N-terminal domain-containing protein n=1 Tax=Trichostrongylus colubriformis TaxID=6319 RepID=A0AAN8ENP7_TRICO
MHRHTMAFHARDYDYNIVKWRIFSLILTFLGFAAALGASIVANFQEGPQLVTHDVGAFLFFIGIVLYFYGQIIIAYGFRPRMVSVHLTNFRLILNIITTALLVFREFTIQYFCRIFDMPICVARICVAKPFVKSVNGTKPSEVTPPSGIVRPKKGDALYNNWLASTISEWVLALLIELHILTYAHDLSKKLTSSPRGSHCSSIIDGHMKQMSFEAPVDQAYTEQSTVSTPSRRRLYRVDQVYATNGYMPPRALPRTMIAPTSNNNQYQYF